MFISLCLLLCADMREQSHVLLYQDSPLPYCGLPCLDRLLSSHEPNSPSLKGGSFLSQLEFLLEGGRRRHWHPRHCFSIFTFNIHPTVHGRFPQGVDGLAGVDASIKGTRLADLQGADPQLTECSVLGVALEIHLVL